MDIFGLFKLSLNMKNFIKTLLISIISISAFAQTINIKILQQPVEVYKDKWGVSHIYAKNEHDLFVTQGYVAASDRLFQLEMWRRQATGTVAELLGERELKRVNPKSPSPLVRPSESHRRYSHSTHQRFLFLPSEYFQLAHVVLFRVMSTLP